MDFLDPKKRRAHDIRLYIGYILIAGIIAMGTLILLLQTYGYDLDRKTGSIIQNGLVFVAAQPESADVYLNGKLQKSQDSARLVLPSGTYSLELKRAGYHTWSRTFALFGGSIERFVYPFLFPEKPSTADRKLYGAVPTFATQSPDRHWIVVQQPGQLPAFDVFDANTPERLETTITVPVALFTASSQHSLKLVEWSTDNRHLLVEHVYEGGHEFLVIDRENPNESINVNRQFKRTPYQVVMRDKRFDRLYLYDQTAGSLALGNLTDGTVAPVLEQVLAFKSHGEDMIVYATAKEATPGTARIMVYDNGTSYVLRDMPLDSLYLLDIARFDGKWYVVAGGSNDGRVYVYKDPLTVLKHQTTVPLIPATVLRIDHASTVSFSANTRFVAAQAGTKFAVYDAENDRSHKYDIATPISATDQARWMDGHRLTATTTEGKLIVFDYDGTNVHILAPNAAGVVPFFDRDYKIMYDISPSTNVQGRGALTRTNLKIIPQQ